MRLNRFQTSILFADKLLLILAHGPTRLPPRESAAHTLTGINKFPPLVTFYLNRNGFNPLLYEEDDPAH